MAELTELIKRGEYEMKEEVWNDISNEAKGLINKILVVDPEKRLSLEECMNHSWFEEEFELPTHRLVTNLI